MKMKLIVTKILPAFFTTGLLFVSCQKNLDSSSKTESKITLQHATDMAGLQNLTTVDEMQQFILAVYPNSAEAKALTSGSCPPVVTYNPAPNVFPRTETIDWGTGCTNANGTTRSGKIIRKYSDTLINVDARLIIKYDNYFINGVHIEGKAKIVHIQIPNTNTYKMYQIDRKVTQPNGDFIIYNGELNLLKKIPGDIHFPPDSTGWYKVKGTQSGDEMKAGQSYQWISTIDSAHPLIYKFCSFVTKGKLHVQFTNQSDWFVDFGKVLQCDNLAEVTQDGVTTTVTLPLDY